jgi:hypothetical protein
MSIQKEDFAIQAKKDFEIQAKKDFEIQAKKDAKSKQIKILKSKQIQAIQVSSYSFRRNNSRAETFQGRKLFKGGNYSRK